MDFYTIIQTTLCMVRSHLHNIDTELCPFSVSIEEPQLYYGLNKNMSHALNPAIFVVHLL